MTRTIWLVIALAAAMLLSWRGTVTPAPLPASAPAENFSAERAIVDIAALSRTAHPVGSPANAVVRDQLMVRMTSLGLSPIVQAADVLSVSDRYPAWLAGARVENLIGVLPGVDRTRPALMLMAHYDTVPGSPGAADDTTGVAAILEIVRALKVRGTPARDVIVVITDGEEWGLSGAEAFFGQHPLARRVGMVLNMEARGGGGRANMFETGADNGALIDRFRATAKKPISSALAVFLYEHMPNDTDFSVAKRAGRTGLNFAFIGRQFDYHSPTSTLANLDPGSVQSMGEQVLAAAADLAFSPTLPGKAPSAVYSQTFGDFVLSYPPLVGWLVWLLAGGLIALAGWRARRAGETPGWRDGVKGGAGLLLTATLAALMLNLARRATGADFGFMEQRPLLAQWGLWEAAMVLLAVGATLLVPAMVALGGKRRWPALVMLLAGAACSLFGGFDPVGLGLGAFAAVLAFLALGAPPPSRSGAWSGVLTLAFVLTGVVQLLVPQVAFLLAWPLVLAALAAAATRLATDGRPTPVLAMAGAVVCGWLGVYYHVTAQGLDLPALLGLFPMLAITALWPLAQPAGGRGPEAGLGHGLAGLLIVAGGALTLVVGGASPWSPRYPQAVSLTHVHDTHAGKAWLTTPDLNPWSETALRQGDRDDSRISAASLPPFADRPIPVAPTRVVPVAAPTLTSRIEPDGRVTVVLLRPPGARIARLNIKTTAAVTDVTVQGLPAKGWLAKAGDLNHLRWAGPDGPITLSFKPVKPDNGAAEIDYASLLEAWPDAAAPVPQLPDNAMAWGLSGATVVTGKAVVRW
ncbi:MAG: M20/M25/M40 family metallo-hydrolase [Caulobacter sp.]|nr:M20/M25/M40 family metallo-hydrolase [Caulobacter sp.]